MPNDKKTPTDTKFDFDYWRKLHENDPAAFEALRNEAIAKLIESAPEHMQARLRGIQFELETQRKLAKNPLDSCVRVYNKMWDSVTKENGLMDALEALNNRDKAEALLQSVKDAQTKNNNVIDFTKRVNLDPEKLH